MDFFLPLPTTEGKQKGGLHSLQPDTLYWYRCSRNIAHFHQGINLARHRVFYEARLLCVWWPRGVSVSVSMWVTASQKQGAAANQAPFTRTPVEWSQKSPLWPNTEAVVSGGENLNWPESNKQSTATKSDVVVNISALESLACFYEFSRGSRAERKSMAAAGVRPCWTVPYPVALL